MPENNSTKHQLADALKLRMISKPLEKITIKELTTSCGVNRQTFYYHFEDIYDLLKWIYQQEIVSLLNDQSNETSWQSAILLLLKYIEKNKAICLCTLNSIGHRHLKNFFYEDVYNVIKKHLILKENLSASDLEFADFVLHFYTLSMGSMLESWILGDFSVDAEQLVSDLERILAHNYKNILKLQ